MPEGRFWTAAEKRAILEEYELAAWGTKGAVLRRHRVTYGACWLVGPLIAIMGLLDGAGLEGVAAADDAEGVRTAEIARLRAEVRRLEAERDQALRDREVADGGG